MRGKTNRQGKHKRKKACVFPEYPKNKRFAENLTGGVKQTKHCRRKERGRACNLKTGKA
jgi:hypothetical protein